MEMKRRWKSGASVSAAVALALASWVLVGWINQRHYWRYDCTADKTYSLSEKTRDILKALEKPVTITTLFRPGTLLEQNSRDLLQEYAGASKNITLVRIDPDRDAAKVEMLAKRLKLDSFQINSVLFECEGRAKQVGASEIEEALPGANPFMPSQEPPKFKGEEAFTSALLNLTQTKAPLIYFSTGHGEKEFEGLDRMGISELVKYLKRENFTVKDFPSMQKGEIPADADALVIASPRKAFLPQEAQAMDAYLKRGGKVLVLLDPMISSGLEKTLEAWGARVGNDVVVDPVRRLFFTGPTTLIVEDFGGHAIGQKLNNSAVILSLARSVQPAASDAQSLLKTSQEAWGETTLDDKQAKFDAGKDSAGPVSLAVAVQRKEAKLVVIGDSDFVSNLQMSNAANIDLFANALNWLTNREKLISIGPKHAENRQVLLNAAQMKAIFWGTTLLMPLAAVILGVLVWLRRRR